MKTKLPYLAAGLLILGIVGCKQSQSQAPSTSENQEVETTAISFAMEPKSDSNVQGTSTFTADGETVVMNIELSGLTPGIHAVHLHETADCSAPDGTSTGGHWNPTFENHGAWGDAAGFHRGDIGNLTADESGNARLTFETNLWCIDCEDPIKNIIGKAVIVHQGTDDLVTQPTGNAGARVSCTGIIK
ncbi:MAG: superoxide dismutase family protein [Flavobacteriaceae bacterium]|jgi:superoxide dismutase, Cu-Zn family|nr:superoxide dismutase family protein [Flavobacteriaceae bacterium]MDP5112723.1 superoxide dismutase family protein [Flavobacteriaceae bacterium]